MSRAERAPRPLTIPLTREKWHSYAACRGLAHDEGNFSRFFAERGDDGSAAKAVCAQCKAEPECLDFAIRENITDGIWGGMSDKQRRRLRKQWRASAPSLERALEPVVYELSYVLNDESSVR